MAKVCKLYGVTPSYYLLDEDGFFKFQIDAACACAYWEDENHHYTESKKQNGSELSAIDDQLNRYREQVSSRG